MLFPILVITCCVLLLLSLGAGGYFFLSAREPTAWACSEEFKAPTRRNAAGDIECMSRNGKDCLWSDSVATCQAHISSSEPVEPLACGAQHKKHWGMLGYDTAGHWCAVLNDRVPK